jgi:hypothetical protein
VQLWQQTKWRFSNNEVVRKYLTITHEGSSSTVRTYRYTERTAI